MIVDPKTRTPVGLLDHRQLSLAVAGHLEGDSPFIDWARELGDLHATLITASASPTRRPADFDERAIRLRVDQLVSRIDDWAVQHLSRPVNMSRHTHSLGEVISHVAAVYAQVQRILRRPGSAQHLHEAAHWMAQTLEGYADLVTAIRERRVQLPRGWLDSDPADNRTRE